MGLSQELLDGILSRTPSDVKQYEWLLRGYWLVAKSWRDPAKGTFQKSWDLRPDPPALAGQYPICKR